MRKQQIITSVLFIFFFSNTIKAVEFSFRHYKAEDGLTINTVRSIIQDRSGFIWFGTEDGLNRFDGHSFKEYRTSKVATNFIGSNYISALLEDSKGNIWIGTDDGVTVYHPLTEKFTHFENKADGISITSNINNIVEDKAGNLWFSTYGQGIFRYHLSSGELEQYRVINNRGVSEVYDFLNYIYVDHSNQVWAAPKTPRNPLIYFDRAKNCFRVFDIKLKDSKQKEFSIYKIFEDSKSNLWLGTWNTGLLKLNKQSKSTTKYLSPESKGGILHVHEISEYSPNILLIGSDDGLSFFNTQTNNHRVLTSSEIDPSALSDKFIYPIFKDREGGIWIGTYFGGVNYLSPNSGLFERYTHSRYSNSVNGNIISRFTEDKKGNIWIASDDGGLNCLNTQTGHFTAYMPQPGRNSISFHNVHALCWDNDDLWIGTYSGGLNVLNTKTGKFKLYNSVDENPKTLDGGSIYAIYKDRDQRMWVASMSGLNLYNRPTDSFIRVKHLNATTIDITQDTKGWIWFATQGKGVFRLNPQTNEWRNYSSTIVGRGSIPCNQLNCITTDRKGQLWAGTSNGLCRFDYSKDCFIPVPLNTPNNAICCIIENNNMLWLTSSKGLIRYNTQNGSCQVFTRSDGLLSDQFIFNSGFKSSTGKIYVGTAAGFNAFCPKNLVTNKFRPPVAITNLEIFNKDVKVDPNGPLTQTIGSMKQIDLSYKDNVFSLGYAALSYITPEKNMYAYKLEGFDKDWNYVNKQNKATYTNLPAGEYVFRVKASNNDGLWNEQGASIKIVIHPPFWLTIGFKLLYLILLITGLIFLLKYTKLRAKRRHDEEIKELNQTKEKELYNAKIQFFTMIAHEIRTPVSLIIGPLEKIMTTAFTFPDNIRNDLNIIDRNSQRLLHLVNQLLDFRKVEQGALVLNFTRQNIYLLLLNIYDRFKPLIEQNKIEFTFLCPDKELEAVIDYEAITKLVSNLLTNAMKFTNNQIILMCNSYPEQGTFEIRVQDNGNGISDVEKEKIFTPFYQIPSGNKPGTGIGLSLVKSLADAHKGTISVTDTVPRGVTFSISLPMRSCEQSEIQEEPKELVQPLPLCVDIVPDTANHAPKAKTDKPVLLIVEDNADMRSFLCSNFIEDYEVISARDGLDGLELIKKHDINLIISDLMMPRMDGMEFCKEIRSNILWSHIPVILLTAKTDLNSKIDGLNIGADSYIEKPFSISHLKAQINNLIESRDLLRRKYSEMPFVSITSIAGNSADEQFLTKVNEIIEHNISNESFSIDILAEELCISRSGLFAKIKTLADITPNELIQLIRLKKAAGYLVQKEYRINEIAYMVGFNNPSYFSKCFQKQFGVRPMDFVDQYKDTNRLSN
ncbi:MAG TPA: two-component regulator propeller domain-containing protein [Paludibacter sp.]|nr:two-component regulator propeller domain-containing protein [Paludibacter sp.]